MNTAIVVTNLELKKPAHATVRLARELTNRGHCVWFLTADDFSLDADDQLSFYGMSVPIRNYRSNKTYLDTLRTATKERANASDLDILLLRDNPARYGPDRSWARQAVALFSQFAVDRGVLVLNDPQGLSLAQNKLYFQTLPIGVRARTLISRHAAEIREFAESLEGDLILKPLQGSGGENVFLIRKSDYHNFNQLLETSLKTGYVIAQEYLPAAQLGDVRIYLMNGKPLVHKGRYAAFRRRQGGGGDIRSNMHAGGHVEPAVITPEILHLCAQVEDKITSDGLFLVGLDIVGDKLIEVNVFCAGGLNSMEKLEGVNFSGKICQEMERKVDYRASASDSISNRKLATMGGRKSPKRKEEGA
jgi:glutathione synthase